MGRLVDIKGYWDNYGSDDFNENSHFEGKIIIEDDGWFEGVVVEVNSSFNFNRLVFGFLEAREEIELYETSPISAQDTFLFRGIKAEKGYDGTYAIFNESVEATCGLSRITIRDIKLFQLFGVLEYQERNIEEEMDTLIKKIAILKNRMSCKEIYESKLDLRKNKNEIDVLRLSKNITKNY